MKATNQQNREQKNAPDRLDFKLMIKKAQEGSSYIDVYAKGYEAGRRRAEIECKRKWNGNKAQ